MSVILRTIFLSALFSLSANLAFAAYTPFNANVAGNIGVGTSTPQAKFVVVNGNVGIGTWTAAGGNLIVNGGGNVGIGSAWPGQVLDVQGTVRALAFMGNGALLTDLPAGGAAGTTNQVQYNNSGNLTGSNNFIFDGTNVGIGSTAPGQALDVQGSVRATNFIGNGSAITNLVNAGTIGQAAYYASSTNTVSGNSDLIFAGSNIGIGSATPGQLLDVQGTVRMKGFNLSTSPTNGYVLTSDASGNGSWQNVDSLDPWTISSNDVYLNPGLSNVGIGLPGPVNSLDVSGNVGIGTDYAGTYSAPVNGMIVEGNVGIGSTNPGQLLDVLGTVRALHFVGNGSQLTNLPAAGSTTQVQYNNAGSIAASNNFVFNGTNVGIGTTLSTNSLDVATNVSIGTAYAGYKTAPPNGLLVQGNVGIGSANPGEALDVNGTIRSISGGIMFPDGSVEISALGNNSWSMSAGNVYTTTGSNNVGIGTSTPQGGFVVTNGNVGIGTWAPADSFQVSTSGTETLMLSSSNIFGVGTNGNIGGSGIYMQSNPAMIRSFNGAGLQLGSSNATDVDNINGLYLKSAALFTWNGDTGLTRNAAGAIEVDNGTAGTLATLVANNVGIGTFAPSGKLIVTGGNVGIGSLTPGQMLDVQGTVRTTGFVMSGQTPMGGYVLTAIDGTGNATWSAPGTVGGWSTGSGTVYTTTGSNNVGIGTSTPQGGLVVTNGNVGIGTWAPAYPIDVNGTGRISDVVFGGLGSEIEMRSQGAYFNSSISDSGAALNIQTNPNTTNPILLSPHGAEAMRIISGGNVGIGTTTPAGALTVMNGNVGIGTWVPGALLDVRGNLRINDGFGYGFTADTGGTGSSEEINLTSTGGTTRVHFDSGSAAASDYILGNVGIGSINPGQALDVNGTIRSISGGIMFPDGSTQISALGNNSWSMSGGNVYTTTGSNNVGIGTSTPQGGLVVTNGNVGIGTWAPRTKLDVEGTLSVASFAGNVGIGTWTPANTLDIKGGVAIGSNAGSANGVANGLDVSGPVGIGVDNNSGSPLTVAGAMYGASLTLGWGSGTGIIQTDGGSKPIILEIGTVEKMRIDTNGNLGIGSTAPGQLLDVQGTARVKGFNLSTAPTNGYVLTSDANGNGVWAAVTGSGTVNSGTINRAAYYTGATAVSSGTYFDNGTNIGIGTTLNTNLLDVAGGVTIGTTYAGYKTAPPNGLIVQGNVGIGSTAPGEALDVNGTIRSISGGIMFPDGSTQTSALGNNSWSMGGGNVYTTNGSNKVGIGTSTPQGGLVVTNGNVGIGTWAPAAALDVEGTLSEGFFAGKLQTTNNILDDGTGKVTIYSSLAVNSGNLSLTPEFVVYDTSNNPALQVGTGSSHDAVYTENNMLDDGVMGNASFQGSVSAQDNVLDDGSGNASFQNQVVMQNQLFVNASGTGNNPSFEVSGITGIAFQVNDRDGSSLYVQTFHNVLDNGAGNVGIGTLIAKNQLVVNGAVGIGTANSSYVTTIAPAGGMIVQGNVGIGSLAPGQAFDVQGTIRTTGFVMSGQNPMSGYVLTAIDGTGNATWSPSSSVGLNYWLNTAAAGNVGISTTNSVGIGTTSGVGAGLVVMNGNVGIGTWVPAQALDVEGTSSQAIFKGSVGIGTTNATYALMIAPQSGVTANNTVLIQDATPNTGKTDVLIKAGAGQTGSNNWEFQTFDTNGTNNFAIDGEIGGGVSLNSLSSLGSNGLIISGNLGFNGAGNEVTIADSQTALATTSGTVQSLKIGDTYNPASGSAIFNMEALYPTVNQTGGANGITRGLYVNPVLTSAADFRAIETSVGNVGIGTISGNLGIGSQWPGQRLDIQGTARVTGFVMSGQNPMSGYVLTAIDGTGNATWSPSSSVGTNYWLNTAAAGNVGISTTNTVGIGTTSAGVGAGLVVMNGNVGIGTWVPRAQLDVEGTLSTATFAGNVGIGSLTPGVALDVQGTVRATGFIAGAGGITLGGVNNTSWPASGNWTTYGQAGNVGVGTTAVVGIGTTSAGAGAGLLVMNGNVGIGTWAPGNSLDVVGGNIGIGTGYNLVGIGTTSTILTMHNDISSIFIGWQAGASEVNGTGNGGNVALGYKALTNNYVAGGFGTGNTAIGYQALQQGNSGYDNTAVGFQSFYSENGSGNTALGWEAGYFNNGNNNTVVGTYSLVAAASGSENSTLGYQALRSNSSGQYNTALGFQAGYPGAANGTVNGSNDVWIGANSGPSGTSDVSNAVGIGSYATAGANNVMVLGGMGTYALNVGIGTDMNNASGSLIVMPSGSSNGNVGIGSLTPGVALDVQGTVRATGFIAGAGGITLGGVNNTSWPAGGNWTTYGQAGNVGVGTTAVVGIGTTSSGAGAGLLVMNGNVGIGTWAPASEFQVNNVTSSPFAVTSTGNVGIGTTTPQGGLVVTNGNVGIGTFAPIGALQIAGVGNVGIGSTAPGAPLDVNGKVRMTGFNLSTSPTNGYVLTSDANGNGTWAANSASGSLWATQNTTDQSLAGGNVGIGTIKTTTAALTVMNGNVGIGTWVPGSSLQINGSAIGNVPLTVNGYSSGQTADLFDINEYPSSSSKAIQVTERGDLNVAYNISTPWNVEAGWYNGPGGAGQIQFAGYGAVSGYSAEFNQTINGWGLTTVGGDVELAAQLYYNGTGTVTGSWTSLGLVNTFGNGSTNTYNGSAPMTSLLINPTINVNTSSTTGYTEIYAQPVETSIGAGAPNYFIQHLASGASTPNFVVTEKGNVGIGSATPGQAIDVQGTVRATGFIAGAAGITLGGVSNTSWPAGGSNYWLNTAAAGNVGISTTNTVGIGTTSGVGAGLVVMNGNVGIGTWVPNSGVQFNQSFAVYRTATAASASTAGQTIIGVTDTTSARTITLANADKVIGRVIIVKDESGGAATNNITVTPATGTIDGASSVIISANYGVVRLYSDGSNWFTF